MHFVASDGRAGLQRALQSRKALNMNKREVATPLVSVLLAPVRALFVSESKQGILLILVAAAALVAANSVFAETYHELFHGRLGWTPIPKLNTLHLWVNDGLMAIFFFVVGLEVKREIIEGQLSSSEQRRLPVVAAIAGMIAPALVYTAIAGSVPGLARGWAIPAATDIAFAMGVLGLLGNRVPASLRMFLLTVAIVDDIGAVLIIALFFTSGIKLTWLIAALVVVGIMVAMNRALYSSTTPYLLLAVVLWFCILNSGVHATVAGVVAALTIPMRGRNDDTMVERVEHTLAPWSAYLIVPIFGFANAGVHVTDLGPEQLFAPLPLAVAAGLVVGKMTGIFGIVFAAEKVGFAQRPDGAPWIAIWGVSMLCGIGFTMSLFIGELAFPGVSTAAQLLRDEAKIGILGGSLISAIFGFLVLRLTQREAEANA